MFGSYLDVHVCTDRDVQELHYRTWRQRFSLGSGSTILIFLLVAFTKPLPAILWGKIAEHLLTLVTINICCCE